MSREEMMQRLTEAGMDAGVLAAIPEGPEGDAVLAEMIRVLDDQTPAEEPPAEEPPAGEPPRPGEISLDRGLRGRE